MLKLITNLKHCKLLNRSLSSTVSQNEIKTEQSSDKFETVFKFPFIRYISMLNRLKVYQIVGTSLALPGCGLMEALNVLPQGALLSAAYIGITGSAVLSVTTLPFRNTIGYLYISSDNQKVKISSMNFWGKRQDKIIATEDWIPLLEMPPKATDAVFLQPKLTDGTKYKLFVKFGNVINPSKMGQVLE
ncbi:transmembrane protein 186 [Trichoplusia ni]|uniref:Transmembrane protein 186 n=1 Tax=Trichoplusia ni TaxID=7111 RepID=A0A7E5VAJ0_TRINI|nr:transmembrane protein 186 [Trichoplusia ni]